jgi:Na+/proline symporter
LIIDNFQKNRCPFSVVVVVGAVVIAVGIDGVVVVDVVVGVVLLVLLLVLAVVVVVGVVVVVDGVVGDGKFVTPSGRSVAANAHAGVLRRIS